MKFPTYRDGQFVLVGAVVAAYLVQQHDWGFWKAALVVTMVFLWGRLYIIFSRRLKKLWGERRDMNALKARIKQLEDERVERMMELSQELHRSRNESRMLSEELRTLSAEAQIRSPANTQTTVRVRSSGYSGVTINGVRNPQGIWVVNRDFDSEVSGRRLHRGNVITYDGELYYGQDGVLNGMTNGQIREGERVGIIRPVEPSELPDAVVHETTEGVMSGVAGAMRDFGFSMGALGRRPSGVNQEAHSRINETLRDATERVAGINERRRKREADLKGPRRRTAWERLDDDDF